MSFLSNQVQPGKKDDRLHFASSRSSTSPGERAVSAAALQGKVDKFQPLTSALGRVRSCVAMASILSPPDLTTSKLAGVHIMYGAGLTGGNAE
jgi:hypothetical protein